MDWTTISLEWAKITGTFLGKMLLWSVPWSMFIGFLFVIASIFAVRFLAKRKYLKRENKYWNICAKLSYVIVVLAFTWTGCASGALVGAQREINQKMESAFRPMLMAQLPTIHEFLSSHLKFESSQKTTTVKEAVTQILSYLYYRRKSDSWWERTKARCINYFTLNFGKRVITETVGALIVYGAEKAGDAVGVSPESVTFTVDVIKRMDLSKVDQSIAKTVTDAIRSQFNSYMLGLYFTLLLIHLGILAVVASEILFYRVYWLSRPKPEEDESLPEIESK